MPLNITEFKGALIGDGARPNLFQVTIDNPVSSIAKDKIPFMVTGAEIPAATLGEIQQFYPGRAVKYAGDRTYADWTVTIINDEDFLIREAMERWNNAINGHRSNARNRAFALAAQYKTSATVTQLSKTGLPLRTYAFEGIYPKEISNITLDWGGNDSIETFTVTFSYDLWEVGRGVLGQVTSPLFN
jgi:hypothetical protein